MSAEEFHKHKPKDIKPQGAGSGLDSDKLDGLHASEIGGGGGPHAASHETGGADKVHFADIEHSSVDATLHDALTSTPHISQADKDKIHDKLHALDSALDHSGVITAAQHGDKSTIPNAHHIKDWTLISQVIPSSNVAVVEWTGLDINTDKFYIIIATIHNPSPSVAYEYAIFVNGDTTITNYYSQLHYADGATHVVRRDNDPGFCYIGALGDTMVFCLITHDPGGHFRYASLEARENGSIIRSEQKAGAKTATITNITALSIYCIGGAAGIGAGSILQIFKVRG